jgi:hypothetical protein
MAVRALPHYALEIPNLTVGERDFVEFLAWPISQLRVRSSTSVRRNCHVSPFCSIQVSRNVCIISPLVPSKLITLKFDRPSSAPVYAS